MPKHFEHLLPKMKKKIIFTAFSIFLPAAPTHPPTFSSGLCGRVQTGVDCHLPHFSIETVEPVRDKTASIIIDVVCPWRVVTWRSSSPNFTKVSPNQLG